MYEFATWGFTNRKKKVANSPKKYARDTTIVKNLRGQHSNRPNKINDDVWELVEKHWSLIPHCESQYSASKSSKKYFVNSELNVKKLFRLFQSYFKECKNQDLNMDHKTYHKHWKKTSNYSFRKPRTDVCDFCTENEIKLRFDPNHPCKVLLALHKKRVEKYKEFKDQLLCAESYQENLIIEFDYAKNLAIPKLNVNKQYYSRQLSLYVFNVHVHNDGSSYLFYYIENEGKKILKLFVPWFIT